MVFQHTYRGMTTRTAAGRGVKSDETLIAILEELEDSHWMGVTEIAESIGVANSTVHRHLQSLYENEFVVEREGQYRLGYRFLEMGGAVRWNDELVREVRPLVQDLAAETEEAAQFVVEEHGRGVFVYREAGANTTRSIVPVGTRFPLHLTPAGKAILAELSNERVRDIVNRHGLEVRTEQTVSDIEELLAELETIRETGLAFDRGENNPRARGVGVSITRPNGEVLGAVSVAGSAYRLEEDELEREIPELLLGMVNEFEISASRM